MEVHSLCRRVFVGFWVFLLLATSFCYGDDMNVPEVVGIGECADCAESNFKTSQAFSGLTVSIECKSADGQIKTRASGNLDEQGKFKLSLPQETFENGKLKEDCFAQLHSAKSTPCPAHDGLESTKIVLQSTSAAGKHTFSTAGKLKFSPATCASAFFWPYYKYPPLPKLPPWPKSHPWFTHKHKFSFPPLPFTPKIFPPKALPPPVPVKPVSPPSPTYTPKPMPPVVKPPPKPISPPSPTYTPKPKPKPKPLPPPTPTYTPKPKPKPKPFPPPTPTYTPKPKPKPPMSKPPPVPMYKPKPKPKPMPKPFPPAVPTYPFPKKPCPPLPKLPPIPKFPPKYFHHPKYGFPPLPPHHP